MNEKKDFSCPKDIFTNYTFSAKEWSADVITSKKLRENIDRYELCGRKIKQIKLIGLSYYLTRNWIESAAYNQLEHLPEEERQVKSEYKNIDPDMKFCRYSEIDEPILIEFEDGDVLEIEAPCDNKFRVSMNRIPFYINAGTNQPNVNSDILFSPCIGQTIASVEINCYIPLGQMELFQEENDEKEIVDNIIIRLENGMGLLIRGVDDYCEVDCIDGDNKDTYISFSELKKALFNWEDLHYDEVTGFEADSPTLFFNEHYDDTPYMTIYSTGNDESKINISSEKDFLLLDWCITHKTGEWFDEYADYHFTSKEWFNILDEAEELLSIETFDELFDKLISWNILDYHKENIMLWKLNHFGAQYWNSRKKYMTQIKDLYIWSKIVLSDNDIIDILGF